MQILARCQVFQRERTISDRSIRFRYSNTYLQEWYARAVKNTTMDYITIPATVPIHELPISNTTCGALPARQFCHPGNICQSRGGMGDWIPHREHGYRMHKIYSPNAAFDRVQCRLDIFISLHNIPTSAARGCNGAESNQQRPLPSRIVNQSVFTE